MKPTPEGKQTISVISRKVANAVTELVQSAEAIKGNQKVQIKLCISILCK